MSLASLSVARQPPLQDILEQRLARLASLRGLDQGLQCQQRGARVAAREDGDSLQERLRDLAASGQPSLRVGQRIALDRDELLLGEWLERMNLGPGEQRRYDLERRILGGGSDQGDVAPLHVRQESVLLGLVEAVDLVDEYDRAAAGAPQPLGVRQNHLHVLDAAQDAAEGYELALRGRGDDARQGGLAGSGRSPQDDRSERVRLDLAPKGLARAQESLLSDELVERAGPHALGQRSLPPRFVPSPLVEQAHRGDPFRANS